MKRLLALPLFFLASCAGLTTDKSSELVYVAVASGGA